MLQEENGSDKINRYYVDSGFDDSDYDYASISIPETTLPEINLWRSVLNTIIADLRSNDMELAKEAQEWLKDTRETRELCDLADISYCVINTIRKKICR